jgi:hypothetical protein
MNVFKRSPEMILEIQQILKWTPIQLGIFLTEIGIPGRHFGVEDAWRVI